jgi:hypothetical protein
MYLKRCEVLHSYSLKVFTKRRKRKLFTRRYITVHSQFQPGYSPVITQLCRVGWRNYWFNVVYLFYLSPIH